MVIDAIMKLQDKIASDKHPILPSEQPLPSVSLSELLTTVLRIDRRRPAGPVRRAWDSHGMLVLDAVAANLVRWSTGLKDEFGFALFLDVTAVDLPGSAAALRGRLPLPVPDARCSACG